MCARRTWPPAPGTGRTPASPDLVRAGPGTSRSRSPPDARRSAGGTRSAPYGGVLVAVATSWTRAWGRGASGAPGGRRRPTRGARAARGARSGHAVCAPCPRRWRRQRRSGCSSVRPPCPARSRPVVPAGLARCRAEEDGHEHSRGGHGRAAAAQCQMQPFDEGAVHGVMDGCGQELGSVCSRAGDRVRDAVADLWGNVEPIERSGQRGGQAAGEDGSQGGDADDATDLAQHVEGRRGHTGLGEGDALHDHDGHRCEGHPHADSRGEQHPQILQVAGVLTVEREAAESRGAQGQAGHQRNPGAAFRGERAGQRCGDDDHRGHGQPRQARARRRPAHHVLHEQRQEERRTEHAEADHESAHRGSAEHRVPEEVQVEHGVGGAEFDHHEGRQGYCHRRREVQDTGVGPAAGRSFDEYVDQGAGAQHREQLARKVHPFGPARELREHSGGEQQPCRSDRDVDPEHAGPSERVHHRPAQDRAGRQAQGGDTGPEPDSPGPLLLVGENVPQNRQAARREQCRTESFAASVRRSAGRSPRTGPPPLILP